MIMSVKVYLSILQLLEQFFKVTYNTVYRYSGLILLNTCHCNILITG